MDIKFTLGRWVDYETHLFDDKPCRKMIYLGTYIDRKGSDRFVEDFETLTDFDSSYDIVGKENKEIFIKRVIEYIGHAKAIKL